MPDIGISTEVLASLKQKIYVIGIGDQINSGAWERLEPSKRVEGFEHTFLWIKRDDAVVGQLWSSSDRKGRSKYPMGVCIHLENLPLEAIGDKPRAILDQVRDGCKATSSGSHVQLECKAAQDQLEAWIATSSFASAPPHPITGPEQKRLFLQDPAFQPDSLGLLRVLHELDNATGRPLRRSSQPATATELRSYHIRVPLGAASGDQALLLWAAFLRCALPEEVPLLLVVRQGTGWVDIIIGNLAGDSMFCLQASLDALPLATAIPYDIAPELRPRLERLSALFLGVEPTSPTVEPSTTSVRPATVSAPTEQPQQRPPPESRPNRALLGLGLVGMAVICAALGFWARPKVFPVHVESQPPPNPPAQDALGLAHAALLRRDYAFAVRTLKESSKAGPLSAEAESCLRFAQAMEEGEKLIGEHKAAEALAMASKALAARPGDALALALENRARAENSKVADDSKKRRELETLLAASRQAITAKEWSRATNLCAQAAGLALDLKDSAGQQTSQNVLDFANHMASAEDLLRLGKFEEARQQAAGALKDQPDSTAPNDLIKVIAGEQSFALAFQDARAALDRREYALALAKADAALALKPGDAQATQIKTASQAEAQGEQVRRKYEDAMNAARAAFKAGGYPQAIAQADTALALRPKDPDAAKLKLEGQQELSYLAATTAFRQGDYTKALGQCETFKGTERFDLLTREIGQEQALLGRVQKALGEGSYASILEASLPGKPAFEPIKATAMQENRALQEATQKLAVGDYSFIPSLEKQSFRSKPPFQTVLEAGRKERDALAALRSSRSANDRQAARSLIANLTPSARGKEPFADVAQWAADVTPASDVGGTAQSTPPNTNTNSTTAANPATTTPAVPTSGNIGNLEKVLRALEIRFGIKDPDPNVLDRDGKPVARETSVSGAKRTEASAKIRYLREYRGEGWLNDDRKARLQKLDDAIRNWKE